ncbi:rCG51805, partial [Rattus norvegicus]
MKAYLRNRTGQSWMSLRWSWSLLEVQKKQGGMPPVLKVGHLLVTLGAGLQVCATASTFRSTGTFPRAAAAVWVVPRRSSWGWCSTRV